MSEENSSAKDKSTKKAGRKASTKAKSGKKAKARQRPKKTGAKAALWTFPKNSLEEAIKIAQAIEEKNAGNPMPAEELAKAVGYKRTNDWRFLNLLRSANQYGLASGTAATRIELQEIGTDIVAPSSASQRQTALLRAFRNVEDLPGLRSSTLESVFQRMSTSPTRYRGNSTSHAIALGVS